MGISESKSESLTLIQLVGLLIAAIIAGLVAKAAEGEGLEIFVQTLALILTAALASWFGSKSAATELIRRQLDVDVPGKRADSLVASAEYHRLQKEILEQKHVPANEFESARSELQELRDLAGHLQSQLTGVNLSILVLAEAQIFARAEDGAFSSPQIDELIETLEAVFEMVDSDWTETRKKTYLATAISPLLEELEAQRSMRRLSEPQQERFRSLEKNIAEWLMSLLESE